MSLEYWKPFLWNAVQHFLHAANAVLHYHIRIGGVKEGPDPLWYLTNLREQKNPLTFSKDNSEAEQQWSETRHIPNMDK